MKRGRALLLCNSDSHCEHDCEPTHRLLTIASQFLCSAGYLLITVDQVILWVDGRYYLSACQFMYERRRHGDEIYVHRYQSEKQWMQSLAEVLAEKTELLIPEATIPHATYQRWHTWCTKHANHISVSPAELNLRTVLLSEQSAREARVRHQNSTDHSAQVRDGSGCATAESLRKSHKQGAFYRALGLRVVDALNGKGVRRERIAIMRAVLDSHELQYFTHNGADDINWILNIRGDDIPYNQIVLCYIILTSDSCSLYLSPDLYTSVVSDSITKALEEDGVRLLPYQQYRQDLSALPDGARVGVVARSVRCDLFSLMQRKRMTITEVDMPIDRYVKTDSEIGHLRYALLNEGVAMVRLLSCIQRSIHAGKRLDEAAVYQLHLDYRIQESSFLCESFPAIIAYGAHAAEIHYSRGHESDTAINPYGVLLIDCGGHYLHGTTDITRVMACGPVSEKEKADYTAVLRAHVALATAYFPHGSNGNVLDLFARMSLWHGRRDYCHGTGHGLGWGFNVHDGPYALSPNAINKHVTPNMIFSNEPGVYRKSSHGIRIESLIRIVETDNHGTLVTNSTHDDAHAIDDDTSHFFACETLSMCPFDRALIRKNHLTHQERDWVNAYHTHVATTLMPHLSAEDRRWLEEKTAPL